MSADSRDAVVAGGAMVLGWLLVTVGVAGFLGARVYPLSLGLLLLSACGWRLVAAIVRDGLYMLTREEPPR